MGTLTDQTIEILEGRGFSKEFPADVEGAYILNQSAVKEFDWEAPVGKKFKPGFGKEGPVIGVVKDFHFESLHHEIKPLFLYFSPQWFSYFSIRIEPVDIPRTLGFLKTKWQELVPDQTFQYTFFDDDIDSLYKNESNHLRRMGFVFHALRPVWFSYI